MSRPTGGIFECGVCLVCGQSASRTWASSNVNQRLVQCMLRLPCVVIGALHFGKTGAQRHGLELWVSSTAGMRNPEPYVRVPKRRDAGLFDDEPSQPVFIDVSNVEGRRCASVVLRLGIKGERRKPPAALDARICPRR
jgi:hypothetical protein